jgi:hypothetical protein
MKSTFAIVITAALALAACGSKNKNTATTPKTDAKSGSMGGATYGTPATGTTPTPALLRDRRVPCHRCRACE